MRTCRTPQDLPRRQRGFTIIELLAVVAIIAVLATVAIAKFGDSKRRAYLTSMKSDLRNVATAAESQYTADNSYVNVSVPTAGSSGAIITFQGTATSWTATATHPSVPGVTCELQAGVGTEPFCH